MGAYKTYATISFSFDCVVTTSLNPLFGVELILHSKHLFLYDCNREDKIARADIVDYILALYNFAKAGVNAIEVLSVATVVADKELRTACVLASVSHRENAAVVVLTLGIGFALDCPTRTTCAIANWATTLNYKFRNYTVETEAVIEARLRQLYKILNSDRCLLLVEFHLHIALLGRNNSVLHSFSILFVQR